MSEQYRLIYSGEVVEGQHPAVVKKRLAAVLKLDDERMDVLFSGKPVVVKKAIDQRNAARYQEVFNQAGARLRVLPLDESAAPGQPQAPASPPTSAAPPTPTTQTTSEAELNILPPGADLLDASERKQDVEADIDTSHLSVQGAVFVVENTLEPHAVPNVDHITLAELGERLGGETQQDAVVVEVNVDFSLAEVGAILGQLNQTPPPKIDLDAVDFEIAEPGAQLLDQPPRKTPPPPDTSHLTVEELPSDQPTPKNQS